MMKICFSIANMLLLTLTAYWGVGGFYAVVMPPAGEGLPAASLTRVTAVKKTRQTRPLSGYQTIMARNLFKVAVDVPASLPKAAAAVALEKLKPTKLKLTLLGTISADNRPNQLAWAVIQERRGGPQDLYRIGDTIKNAKLKLILRERVILSIDGRDEVLEMEKAVQNGPDDSKPAGPQTAPPKTAAPETRAADIPLKRTVVEKAYANLDLLAKQTRIRPNYTNGRVDGYRLSRIPPNSILRQMRLRRGDIILAVNGESLTSPDEILKVYDSLKSNDSMVLTIKRNNRQQTINYHFE